MHSYRPSRFTFGESVLLVEGSPSAVTITAVTKCRVVALKPGPVGELCSSIPELKNSISKGLALGLRQRQNLETIPFFHFVQKRMKAKEFNFFGALDLLGSLFVYEGFKSREVIFKEGDPGDKFYIVSSLVSRRENE